MTEGHPQYRCFGYARISSLDTRLEQLRADG
jgi:hypothetical protein